MSSKQFAWTAYTLSLAGVLLTGVVMLTAGQQATGAPAIDSDDIGGVVTGARGPEAGVWVIAETRDTPTRLIKSVVTDDQGRYLVPDLPKADYDVWVRGYGLVDSPKVKAAPGKSVEPEGGRRARQESGGAVLSRRSTGSRCCRCRRRATSPAPGRQGNGISPNIKSQGEWIRNVVNTDGCTGCHQMGSKATRDDSDEHLGTFEDSKAAWDRRIQAGQAGGGMSARFTQVGRAARAGDVCRLDRSHRAGRAAERRAAASAGPRAQRRHHDVGLGRSEGRTCTTRSPPTSAIRPSTPNGPIYGALEESGDYLPVVDPKTQHARARSS